MLPLMSSAQIMVAALIIAKAVLLADLWPPINRFPEKLLIYNIAWKTRSVLGRLGSLAPQVAQGQDDGAMRQRRSLVLWLPLRRPGTARQRAG